MEIEVIDGQVMGASDVIAQPPAPIEKKSLLEIVIEKGADLDTIQKMIELQERNEARDARRAFNEAMAAAKAAMPTIAKNRKVSFDNRGGQKTEYWHEDLAGIAAQVDPILSRHGLAYRFRPTQNGGTIRVDCIISHRAGYSEEVSLEAAADNSGGKNSIQAVGSTVTYLQRYTLKAALGLSAAQDDDGEAAGRQPARAASITSEQFIELRDLIEKAEIDEAIVLTAARIEHLEYLAAQDFESVKRKLLKTITLKQGNAQ